MPAELSPKVIVIEKVTAPLMVTADSTFTVNVTVFAPDEDFEDGVAYRLYLFVSSLGGNPPVNTFELQSGHVQDGFWTAQTSTTSFTVTAGAAAGLYGVTAAVLEGKQGVPDADDPPSVFCTDCSSIIVV